MIAIAERRMDEASSRTGTRSPPRRELRFPSIFGRSTAPVWGVPVRDRNFRRVALFNGDAAEPD